MSLQAKRTPGVTSQKTSKLSINELRNLGETHLGYVFLTFATPIEAKRALVLAKMNFDPFVYDPDQKTPKIDLLKDDYHMDFDEEFQLRHLARVQTTESQLNNLVEGFREQVISHEE